VGVLLRQDQYGSILFVLLTVIYSFYFVYQILKWKGMGILRCMQGSEQQAGSAAGSDLEEMLRIVARAMYEEQSLLQGGGGGGAVSSALHCDGVGGGGDGDGDGADAASAELHAHAAYRTSAHLLQRKALARFWLCVITFVLGFIAVNP
jgi:hypothetical protein